MSSPVPQVALVPQVAPVSQDLNFIPDDPTRIVRIVLYSDNQGVTIYAREGLCISGMTYKVGPTT